MLEILSCSKLEINLFVYQFFGKWSKLDIKKDIIFFVTDHGDRVDQKSIRGQFIKSVDGKIRMILKIYVYKKLHKKRIDFPGGVTFGT